MDEHWANSSSCKRRKAAFEARVEIQKLNRLPRLVESFNLHENVSSESEVQSLFPSCQTIDVTSLATCYYK